MNSSTHKLLAGCTMALIPVICFAVQFPSVDLTVVKKFYGSIVVFVIVGLWLIETISNRSETVRSHGRMPLELLIALAFLAVHIIWTLCSEGPFSVGELTRITPGIALTVIWWSIGVTPGQRRCILTVFGTCSAMLALGGIAQILGFDPLWNYSFREGVFSTIGHPNMLAAFLVSGGAVHLSLGYTATANRGRWYWGTCGSLALLCLILTASKGAWAGAVIAGVTVMLTSRPFMLKRRIAIGLGVVVVIMIAVGGLTIKPRSLARISSEYSLRPAIWMQSFNILNSPKRWLFGTGPGTWFVHFPTARGNDFLPQFRRCENIRHAHNEYLEQLTDTGLTGLCLFLGVILPWLWKGLKRLRHHDLDLHEVVLLFSVMAISIHGLVSVNLRAFSVWTLLWFCLALVSPAKLRGFPFSARVFRCIHMNIFGVLILVLGFGIWIAYGATQSAFLQYQGQIRMKSKDRELAITYLTRAIEMDPGNVDATYNLAVMEYEARRFVDSDRLFGQIGSIVPDFQRIHMNRALLYLDWSRHGNQDQLLHTARDEIIRELELNDMDENYYILGLIETDLGNNEASRMAFREFLKRLDVLRTKLEVQQALRSGDSMELIRPENWELLMQMEQIARSHVADQEVMPECVEQSLPIPGF